VTLTATSAGRPQTSECGDRLDGGLESHADRIARRRHRPAPPRDDVLDGGEHPVHRQFVAVALDQRIGFRLFDDALGRRVADRVHVRRAQARRVGKRGRVLEIGRNVGELRIGEIPPRADQKRRDRHQRPEDAEQYVRAAAIPEIPVAAVRDEAGSQSGERDRQRRAEERREVGRRDKTIAMSQHYRGEKHDREHAQPPRPDGAGRHGSLDRGRHRSSQWDGLTCRAPTARSR
jgi:hypothetical protein